MPGSPSQYIPNTAVPGTNYLGARVVVVVMEYYIAPTYLAVVLSLKASTVSLAISSSHGFLFLRATLDRGIMYSNMNIKVHTEICSH